MKSKLSVFVVNGVSGSGKDSLCSALSNSYHTSVIDPVKHAFKELGIEVVRESATESIDREILSDIYEKVMGEYPNIIMDWIMQSIDCAKKLGRSTLTICARQPRDIERIKKLCDALGLPCKSVYISRDGVENKFDNSGDNNAADFNYKYDLYFNNNSNITSSGIAFAALLTENM